MERRLAVLLRHKAKTLISMEDCAANLRQILLNGLETLNRQIAATQQRLENYRFQQRHEN